ncbi:MAG: tRNA uridine-5-carboxymethylaminomethyl(34) synthesis GTPase MnmE [Spirochaetota bacterium]
MDNQTICAPASAPVQSALAVIRISGPDAVAVVRRIFSHPERIKQRRAAYGWILDGDARVDDVVCTCFTAPHSFTGEDTVEISCHGNPLIVQNIITLLQRDTSVRIAQPGEFTRRAFKNGKIDLTAAQAVDAIIRARSGWEISTALRQMHGSLRTEIDSMRSRLIELRADVEAAIDFSEEHIEFVSREEITDAVGVIGEQLSLVLQRCRTGERIAQGLSIAIVGKPNAGKSSILNYIVNEERAIVSDIPGTTRDLVRETVQLNGIHLNLIDTAGIRYSEDAVEKIGIQRSREAVEKAHIVLAVLDLTTGITDEDRNIFSILPEDRVIFLLNKSDIADSVIISESDLPARSILFSARTGEGFAKLEEAITAMMHLGLEERDQSFLADTRIIAALEKSKSLCGVLAESAASGNPEEIVASDIQELLDTLQEITGEVTTDDVLESIFSRFCIGK